MKSRDGKTRRLPKLRFEWIDEHLRGVAFALTEELQAVDPFMPWMLGAWTDTEIAARCGVPLDKVSRLRCLMGVPGLPPDVAADLEFRVGWLVREMTLDGYWVPALNLRRWAAGLPKVWGRAKRQAMVSWCPPTEKRNRWAEIERPGLRQPPTSNCHSCRWWGVASRKVTGPATCECLNQGPVATYARVWLKSHGGSIGRLPLHSSHGCPGWGHPDHRFPRVVWGEVMGEVDWIPNVPVSTVTQPSKLPWPFDRMTTAHIIELESWTALCELMAERRKKVP